MMFIYRLITFFFIYAYLGWVVEVAYQGVSKGKLVNRGFLNGPVCPIYGVGMNIVIVLLTPLSDSVSMMFLLGILFTSSLELFVGWLLDVLFHMRWWDYTDQKYNIKGYVCLRFSIIWGLGVVLMMRIVHPLIASGVSKVPLPIGIAIDVICTILIIIDLIVTYKEVIGISRNLGEAEKVASALKEISDSLSTTVGTTAIATTEAVNEGREKMAVAVNEGKEKVAVAVNESKEKMTVAVNESKEKVAEAVNESKEIVSEAVSGVADAMSIGKEKVVEAAAISRDKMAGAAAMSRDKVAGAAALSRGKMAGAAVISRDKVVGAAAISRDKVVGAATISRDKVAGAATISRDKIVGAATISRDKMAEVASNSRDKMAGMMPEKQDKNLEPVVNVDIDEVNRELENRKRELEIRYTFLMEELKSRTGRMGKAFPEWRLTNQKKPMAEYIKMMTAKYGRKGDQ